MVRVKAALLWAPFLVACSSAGTGPNQNPDAGMPLPQDGGPVTSEDRDGDGIRDATEMAMAQAYLPYISLDPADGCPQSGMLVRVRPHPKNAKHVLLQFVQVYERDCGLGGHPGDAEVFAMTVDPTKAGPDGIRAIRSIAHQGTSCQHMSECGHCKLESGKDMAVCATLSRDGTDWPALWMSKHKHGGYLNKGANCGYFSGEPCKVSTCTDAPTPLRPLMVNVGEPGRPLVRDLTDQGFITTQNGWTDTTLFHYDPWGKEKFGTIEPLSSKLTGENADKTFVTPDC